MILQAHARHLGKIKTSINLAKFFLHALARCVCKVNLFRDDILHKCCKDSLKILAYFLRYFKKKDVWHESCMTLVRSGIIMIFMTLPQHFLSLSVSLYLSGSESTTPVKKTNDWTIHARFIYAGLFNKCLRNLT